MDLKKYGSLRNKIKSRDFEQKYSKLDKFLYFFSWGGNAGSIFFAYFLVFPAFFKAIRANMDGGNFSIYIAGIFSVIVLGVFELVKREILSNLSFDFIKNMFKVTKKSIGWLFFSLALICASFYFSLNGAMNFADTSDSRNVVIEKNLNDKIDSLTQIYITYKAPFIEDNSSLRQSNVDLRAKISETPLNYRTVRNELQGNVDKNLDAIAINDSKIKEFDDELSEKITMLENDLSETKSENKSEDIKNIYVFLVISTSIEIIIILGVFFREFYDYTVYKTNSSDLEDIMIKRERYNILLKFIFKEGTISQGQQVISAVKLKEVVNAKSNIPSSNKFVDTFISDISYMGILRNTGNRRYAALSYEDALKKIEKFDDTLRLLEDLK